MTQSDRRLLALAFLCFAVLDQFGNLSSAALVGVLLSILFGVMSLSPGRAGPPLPRAAGVVLVVVVAATSLLYGHTLPHGAFSLTFVVIAASVTLHSLVRARWATAIAFVAAAGATTAGVVANLTWGFANIDVFGFQQRAAAALLHGQDPYSPLVASPNVIPPGLIRWLPLHLPYGPVIPLLEAPFRLLGDVRVLHVVGALVTAAATLVLARRAGTFDRSAALVMAFPLTIGMILFSWVDIITMAALAVWFVSFRSHPKVATTALVIALAAKPTTFIALVPILFWSVRARRQALIAAAIAVAVVLPFALFTGLSNFYYDVLGVQLYVLPRLDALTINSYLHAIGLPLLPFAVSAAVVSVTCVIVLMQRPRTYGDLLSGTAILATVSFLVAKWAYFNYYYIPAVLLVLAIAGDSLELDLPELIRPPQLLTTLGARLAVAARVRGPTGAVDGVVSGRP